MGMLASPRNSNSTSNLYDKLIDPVRSFFEARRSRMDLQQRVSHQVAQSQSLLEVLELRSWKDPGPVRPRMRVASDEQSGRSRTRSLPFARTVWEGRASIASATDWRASFPRTVGKSMPIEPPMSSRQIAFAASRAPTIASSCEPGLPSTSIDVIAGVTTIRSSPPAKPTTPVRASSMRVFQPKSASSSLPLGKTRNRARLMSWTDWWEASVSLQIWPRGLFQGSIPGIASRVTAIVTRLPSVAAPAPFGRRYSMPRSSRTTAFRFSLRTCARRALTIEPARMVPSSSIRVSRISPFSTQIDRVSPMPRSTSHSDKRVTRGF